MCLHAGGILLCFFFKQKTAYEVRISDWSSDVCSSDLRLFVARLSQEDTVLDDQGRPHLRRRGSERRNRIDRDHPRRRRARRQPGHVDDCRGRRDRTRGRNDPYPGLQQYPGLLLRSADARERRPRPLPSSRLAPLRCGVNQRRPAPPARRKETLNKRFRSPPQRSSGSSRGGWRLPATARKQPPTLEDKPMGGRLSCPFVAFSVPPPHPC